MSVAFCGVRPYSYKLMRPSRAEIQKPLIYLDQNILGEPLEALIGSSRYSAWRDNVVIVFSDETLTEILRYGDGNGRFLKNLEAFETAHIFQEMRRFRPTGEHILKFERPTARYREMIEEGPPASPDLLGLGVLHKLFGGETDRSYYDISAAQVDAMRSAWRNEVKGLDLPADLRNALEAFHDQTVSLVSAALSDTASKLAQQLEPGGAQTTSVSFRRDAKIDVEAINAIEGNGSILKIWETIQAANPSLHSMSFDAFCHVEGVSPYTGIAYSIPDKVRSMMLILNLIGYKSDKKLSRADKFLSSHTDLAHAAYGSLCDAIISNDVKFRNRLASVFDYLDVPTQILTSDAFAPGDP